MINRWYWVNGLQPNVTQELFSKKNGCRHVNIKLCKQLLHAEATENGGLQDDNLTAFI